MKTVYHGSSVKVENPLAKLGRKNLDFGEGFYVTDIRNQAVRWAERIAGRTGVIPILNIYELDMKMVYEKYRVLKFEDYDKQWLDFIVSSRNGEKPWSEYDMIEGGVANDHVIDTIEAYMNGYMTIEMALGQLALHRPNNQICLLNQQLIDACLHFKSTESLNSQSHA